VVLFADDTNILVIDKNKITLQEKIKGVISQLESWFSKSKLVINTEKTKAMLFKLNKLYDMSEPVIIFKNIQINYTSQFRFLGINITHNLKWISLNQSLCFKFNNVCYFIKSLKNAVSLYILKNIYILPNLNH
jgi:hypothetical protein